MKIAEESDPDSESVKKLGRSIAYRLFYILKSRVSFIGNLADMDESGKQKWLSFYISSMKMCYEIYPTNYFLKQIANYFYGHDQENWFDYVWNEVTQEFQLTHGIAEIDDSEKYFNNLVSLIKKENKNYSLPIIIGSDFFGSLDLPLDELLQKRNEEKNILDAEILKAKLAQEEADRIEQERLETERLEREAKLKREKTYKKIKIVIVTLAVAAIGLFFIINYFKVFLLLGFILILIKLFFK